MKRIFPLVLLFILFIIVINKCSFHQIPKERLSLFKPDYTESYANDEYQLTIKNPIDCPLRFLLSCQDEAVNEILSKQSPILLAAKEDTIIKIKGKGDLTGKINRKARFGNPTLPIRSTIMKNLPYPKGKSYQLLQGNNSNPTYKTVGSRYAFDFTMEIGDTIISVQNGYVVGVIDGYKGWGNSDKWKSYGNQVIVYDTISHLFTTYGHLKQDGGLVEVGAYVKIGQPIAISGQTGQCQEPHLHFNVFQAVTGKGGLKSYRLDSIGRYKVKDLKRNQEMKN